MASRNAARMPHADVATHYLSAGQPERELPPARRQRPRRGPVSRHDLLAPALIVTLTQTLPLTRQLPTSGGTYDGNPTWKGTGYYKEP